MRCWPGCVTLSRRPEGLERRGILDRGRISKFLAQVLLADEPANHLATLRFRQRGNELDGLWPEGRTKGLDHLFHHFRAKGIRWLEVFLEDDKADDGLSFELVRDPDHGSLGDRRMFHQRVLDLGWTY